MSQTVRRTTHQLDASGLFPDASLTRSGEGATQDRNRAGMTGLSTSTRRTRANRSGVVASSIVIQPLRPDKANIGSASRVASTEVFVNVRSGADLPAAG